MSTRKKMTIVIVALCVAIVATMSAIVVVLVSANQSGNAIVSVKYQSNDVAVTIWANCYIGTTTYNFLTENGQSSISLSPDTIDYGQLYQPSRVEGLALDRNTRYAVFEYIFQNDSDDIDINIVLSKIPGDSEGEVNTGLQIKYLTTNTKVTEFNLDSFTAKENTPYVSVDLVANSSKDAKAYVYVLVSIDNLLYSAEFMGNFLWNLNRI